MVLQWSIQILRMRKLSSNGLLDWALFRAIRLSEDTLLRRTGELSLRSSQRHFLRSTGITYATFRQVERARYATNLLREGVPIFDVVLGAGYFDQAHLTRSLSHFIGQTPSRIIEGQKQLSFLYKTNPKAEAIVIPEHDALDVALHQTSNYVQKRDLWEHQLFILKSWVAKGPNLRRFTVSSSDGRLTATTR